MKNVFYFLSVILIPVFSNAQQWTQKTDFGGSARRSAIAFCITDKGYVGLGYNGNFYKDLWEYDPVADTWTQKADFGGTARFAAVAFASEGKGYVGTGYDLDNNFYTSDFWQYDPINNSWLQVASIPVARNYSTAFAIGAIGYVGTGTGSSGYLNDFWAYDTQTDTWTQKQNFPGDPRYECAGFSILDFGYIGIGAFAGTLYTDFYQYTPETDSWTQKADYPGSGQDATSYFSLKDGGYVCGGYDQQNWYNDFWHYDQFSDTWTQLENCPGAPRAFGVGVGIISKGYVGLGEYPLYFKDWWEYSPDTSVATSVQAISTGNFFELNCEGDCRLISVHYKLNDNAELIFFDVAGRTLRSFLLNEENDNLSIHLTEDISGICFYEVRTVKEKLYSGQVLISPE